MSEQGANVWGALRRCLALSLFESQPPFLRLHAMTRRAEGPEVVHSAAAATLRHGKCVVRLPAVALVRSVQHSTCPRKVLAHEQLHSFRGLQRPQGEVEAVGVARADGAHTQLQRKELPPDFADERRSSCCLHSQEHHTSTPSPPCSTSLRHQPHATAIASGGSAEREEVSSTHLPAAAAVALAAAVAAAAAEAATVPSPPRGEYRAKVGLDPPPPTPPVIFASASGART
eukprot:CAMPEP_0179913034 /NCGR_PEP_ID=MMETSP0983-20121128/232_1 /TAXON_ID=483367 /ORGANISM="non described non described, Strain CCMP 2436" /LENGTH=229 /DNA_ID=CAMNT_0021814971 /DNA_START=147 /DNA_END=833 /DNA_ORIENTATION=+